MGEAERSPVAKKKKSSGAAKPKAASSSKPTAKGFGPPDWRNVFPPPIELIATGNAKLDEALRAVFDGTADAKAEKAAAKATDEQLIAMFRGNALEPARPFHDDKLVNALTPAEKRARNKVYWACEAAKNARERVFLWFCHRLASSPAGRTHLLDVAAGEHAGRLRGMAAHALRESTPDAALWQQIGERLDPTSWVGAIARDGATYLVHTYVVGAVGALVTDPAAAFQRWAPLLDPKTATASARAGHQASAIILGVRDYIGEVLDDQRMEEGQGRPERDATPCVPFIPYLLALLDHQAFEHYAMFALQRLPFDPRVATAMVARLGDWKTATHFGDTEVKLLSKSSDPAHLPWLAAALGNSWMHWPAVFKGLSNMGDPRGIAVIEAWLADNDASDRRGPAKRAIQTIRERAGEPTAAQREEAVAMLAAGDKRPKKTKKKR